MTTADPAVAPIDPAASPRVYPGTNAIHISAGNHEVTVLSSEVAHLIDALIEAKRLVS